MKIYKLKTSIGTYYDVVSDNGVDELCTNKNGRKWYAGTRKLPYVKHDDSTEIEFSNLPKSLQSELTQF